jgi:hypothetical protein
MSPTHNRSDPARPARGLDRFCPNCEAHLTIHQPDPQRPDRLLGACLDCGAWSLVHGKSEALLLLTKEDPPGGGDG